MPSTVMLAGTGRVEISTNQQPVNDPLYAKVLVIAQGETRLAIISLDTVCLGGGIGDLSDSFFPTLKQELREAGFGYVLCGTTHTHTSMPMLCKEEEVLARIISATHQALSRMEPVTVGSGTGRDNSFLMNRTLPQPDGKSWSVRLAHPCPPGKTASALPPADDRIGILRFDKLDGSLLCVLFTFGCHPLLGYANNLPTANFPGIAERLIEDQLGCMAMMFQSCGGDVIEKEYKNYNIPKNCKGPGISLGFSVLKALSGIQTRPVTLSLATETGNFPLRKDIPQVRAKLLAQRDAVVSSIGNCPLDFGVFLPLYLKYLIDPEHPLDYTYAYLWEQAHGSTQLRDQDLLNRKHLDKYMDNLRKMEHLSKLNADLSTLEWHEAHNLSLGGNSVPGEVLGIKLDDCILITAPVEPLCAIGFRMQQYAPLEKTFLIGYSNGYMHYGAPPEAYSAGGYETVECMLAPDWLRLYEELACKVFSRL